jgi:hypothetical protein
MIIRLILYLSKYYYLRKVIKKHYTFVKGNFENASEADILKANKAGSWVEENIIEIKRVVLKTGIPDSVHTYMKPIGYGNLQPTSMSALDNMLYKNNDILIEARAILDRAKGFYKVESIKCINPVFWVEFIVFFPKEIIKYFTIDEKSKSVSLAIKIIQLLYWIVSIIFMYLNYKK